METTLQFGPKKGLIGILSEPESPDPEKPAFIITNSGLLHRVGPFRFYVNMTRRLASAGFSALRMDLSGKGDSAPRRDGKLSQQNVIDDLKDTMTFLEEKKGIRRFVVMGVCTGADNSYQAAFNDERVAGIIPVDGYAYQTFGFYSRHYGPHLLKPKKWANFTSRQIKRLMTRLGASESEAEGPSAKQNRMTFPPKREFAAKLGSVLERGVKVLIVYSGGWVPFYNYKEQFRDAFPSLARHRNLNLEYFPKADHTFILRRDREELMAQVCSWARTNF